MEVKGLFWKDQTIGKINEVQLGLISTSTSEVVIETSLVSPVDTKQVRKAVQYRTASVHTRTDWMVWYHIFPISGPLFRIAQFLDLFSNGPLEFFLYPCEHNPSLYHFLELTEVEWYDIVPVWTGPRTWTYDYFD